MQPDLIPALGALQSPPDYRNIPLSVMGAVLLPESYATDVSAFPVWNQKKIGSCVGHAMAKAMQIYWYGKTGKVVNFSPRFLFAVAKSMDGLPGDVGTYPRLVASIAKNVGCCTEELLPNNSDLSFADYTNMASITPAMYAEAAQYKIPAYVFASGAGEIRQAIYQYGAVAVSMRIGQEWWTRPDGVSSWDKNDIDPLRIPKAIVSGHETVLYGYSGLYDSLYNSWSPLWADSGKNKYNINDWAPYVQEAIAIADVPPGIVETVKKLPTRETFRYSFKHQIDPGARGADVIALQTALMIDGHFSQAEYASLLATNELGYFKPGGDTVSALLKYQAARGILPYPRVGPATLKALNAEWGG